MLTWAACYISLPDARVPAHVKELESKKPHLGTSYLRNLCLKVYDASLIMTCCVQVRLATLKGEKGRRMPVAIKEVREDAGGACITMEAKLHAKLSHPRIVPVLAVLPSQKDTASISGLVTPYCEGGSLGEWLDLLRSRSAERPTAEGGAGGKVSPSNTQGPPDALPPQQQHLRLQLQQPLAIPGVVLGSPSTTQATNATHAGSNKATTPRSFLVPWRQRLRIAEHMLEALSHMHALHVCHLDIKPGNVLMRSARADVDADVLLCDFGLARYVDGSFMPGRYRGTWPYMPPEMVFNSQTRAHPALDVWSLGVVLLDLVSDFPVGHLMSPEDIKCALRRQELYADLGNASGVRCEPEWLQLVRLCLQYDPSRRPIAQRLLEFVRAQIALCDHRERMRCMHAAVLRSFAAGGSLGLRAGSGGGGGAAPLGGFDGVVATGSTTAIWPGVDTFSRARHLNLPESLCMHGVHEQEQPAAPARVKVVRGAVDVPGRCAQLNLPESLELYTAKTSVTGRQPAAWDAASGGSPSGGSSSRGSAPPGSTPSASSGRRSPSSDGQSSPRGAVVGGVAVSASDNNHSVSGGEEGEEGSTSACCCAGTAARNTPFVSSRDHSYLPNSLGLY